ncbi:MAG: hypothetical protein HRT73_15250 [Flavobacteriales bacterium]|nr:hypothetical protein [Flavobacteriales bacterium]NQX99215.1 hypothetical protein [Flavobacteriales bacterium]
MAEKKEKRIKVKVKSTITVGESVNGPLNKLAKLFIDSSVDSKVKVKLVKEGGKLVTNQFTMSEKLNAEEIALGEAINKACLELISKVDNGDLIASTKSVIIIKGSI